MSFKNILKDLNISKNDYFYLFVLTVFGILISYYMIDFNEHIGIYCSDVFIYLTNSLVFAGYGSSRVYLYLSPLICILTSFLFRLGFLTEISLYLVTAFFAILGNIGLYVFLRNRFSSLLSLCGAILFGSFSLTLLWWANGTLDVPAVTLSIWALVFIVLAIGTDSKYYLLAIPILVLAIFTRYTALFLLPLIFLYYLSLHDFFSNLELLALNRSEFLEKLKNYLKGDEFKNILKSFALAIVLIMLFSATIIASGSYLSFLTQSSTFASGSKGEVVDSAYTNDTFYYIHEFPNFLFADHVVFDGVNPILIGSSVVSYLLIALFALGLVFAGYKLIKAKRKENLENQMNRKGPIKYFRYFVAILFVFLLIMAILSFKINSIITLSILLVDFVILFSFLRKNNIGREKYALNIFTLAWFLVYFIFFTFLNIKVNRYIITVFPAFIYFAILAIDEILSYFESHDFLQFKDKNILSIIPIILIVFCIFSAFAFPSAVHYNEDFNKNKVIADYLMDYDSDYDLKEIAAYNQRSLNWYLKDNTVALTDEQLDYLEASNITYYISDDNFKLENYTMIYDNDGLYLYERIT